MVSHYARLQISATRTATQPHTIGGTAFFGCVLLTVEQADSIQENEPGVAIVGKHTAATKTIETITPVIVNKDAKSVKPSDSLNGWNPKISTFASSTT